MKYVAIVLAGLLLAAAVHFAALPRGERVRIVQVSPTPVVTEDDPAPAVATLGTRAAVAGTGAATGGAPVPAPASPAAVPSPAMPVDTGTAPPGAPSVASNALPLPSGLVVPVQGVQPAQLSPTFTDARGGGRTHEALDIMAPAGTPVLAVADGHVEKLFDSKQGGLTIYQFEPGGKYAYYYAHLERYAPGLAERQQVRRGEVIGYVGSTGNADPAAPHLHFAIFALGPDRRWWEGTAIDPYPLLSGRSP